MSNESKQFDSSTVDEQQGKNNAKRFNKSKVDLSLLPETAAYEECKVWMFGEQKYGRDNWKKLWGDKSIEVATASLLRHALSLASGKLYDEESGLPHASHIRCNAAMILEHMANEEMIEPKIYKQPVKEVEVEEKKVSDNLVKIEYTDYYSYYGGGQVGYREKKHIPLSQLNEVKQTHENVKVLDGLFLKEDIFIETEDDVASYYKGGCF